MYFYKPEIYLAITLGPRYNVRMVRMSKFNHLGQNQEGTRILRFSKNVFWLTWYSFGKHIGAWAQWIHSQNVQIQPLKAKSGGNKDFAVFKKCLPIELKIFWRTYWGLGTMYPWSECPNLTIKGKIRREEGFCGFQKMSSHWPEFFFGKLIGA